MSFGVVERKNKFFFIVWMWWKINSPTQLKVAHVCDHSRHRCDRKSWKLSRLILVVFEWKGGDFWKNVAILNDLDFIKDKSVKIRSFLKNFYKVYAAHIEMYQHEVKSSKYVKMRVSKNIV
jgi:hypothetical protein